jgi:hypothetical protein
MIRTVSESGTYIKFLGIAKRLTRITVWLAVKDAGLYYKLMVSAGGRTCQPRSQAQKC